MTNGLVAQLAAQVGTDRIEALGQRSFHVDLEEKVHATAQVKAEVHRQCTHTGQPLRRTRKQIQCNDVLRVSGVGVELLFEQIPGLELGIRVFQANLDAVGVEEDAEAFDARCLERTFDAFQRLDIDLERGFGAGHLYSRRLAKKVRQGIDKAEHQREADDDVFPQRIAVHRGGEESGVRSWELV